jgi:hypothetical protein
LCGHDLEIENGSSVKDIALMHKSTGVLRGGDTVHFVPKFNAFRFSQHIISADLLIMVRYRTIWQQTKDKRERFSVNRDSEGQLRYLRKYLTPEDRAFRPEEHTTVFVR